MISATLTGGCGRWHVTTRSASDAAVGGCRDGRPERVPCCSRVLIAGMRWNVAPVMDAVRRLKPIGDEPQGDAYRRISEHADIGHPVRRTDQRPNLPDPVREHHPDPGGEPPGRPALRHPSRLVRAE